jgi:hypothetical protein
MGNKIINFKIDTTNKKRCVAEYNFAEMALEPQSWNSTNYSRVKLSNPNEWKNKIK